MLGEEVCHQYGVQLAETKELGNGRWDEAQKHQQQTEKLNSCSKAPQQETRTRHILLAKVNAMHPRERW